MRNRLPDFTLIIFGLLIVSISCCLVSTFVLNNGNISYLLTLASYSRRAKTSGVKFHFDIAETTKIVIRPETGMQNPFEEETVEDPKQIELAKQFIQSYSTGWIEKSDLDLLPLPVATVTFYNKDNRKLGEFSVGNMNVLLILKRSSTHAYWRYIKDEELTSFLKVLDIRTEVLGWP